MQQSSTKPAKPTTYSSVTNNRYHAYLVQMLSHGIHPPQDKRRRNRPPVAKKVSFHQKRSRSNAQALTLYILHPTVSGKTPPPRTAAAAAAYGRGSST